jgi:hypothetical protein
MPRGQIEATPELFNFVMKYTPLKTPSAFIVAFVD